MESGHRAKVDGVDDDQDQRTLARVSRVGSVRGFGRVDVVGSLEDWEDWEGSSGRPLVDYLALCGLVNGYESLLV